MPPKIRAIMFLALASAIWGLSFPIGRYALEIISPMALASLRYLFGSLALLPLAWRWRRRPAVGSYFGADHRLLWLWAGFISGTFLTLGTALQLEGLAHSTAGKAGFLTTLYVSLVPVLAFVLGLIPRAMVWVGLSVGLVGLFLLTGGGAADEGFAKSDGLLLAADVFWALQVLATGHYALRINAWLFSFAQAFVCCAQSLAWAVFTNAMPTWPEFIITLPTTAWGILSIGLAFSCQTIAQRDLAPTSAALIMPLQAVIGAIAGAVFLGEDMTSTMILGAGILMFGAFIAQFAKDPAAITREDKNWKPILILRAAVGLVIGGGGLGFIVWAWL
jgi:drug/metabolite transporter (DMT)-like permease